MSRFARALRRHEIQAYFKGKREGVILYAWWKDGAQYVGTTGTTLKEALEEIHSDENEALAAASKTLE